MVPCKAQALANAQSAFMKREETVRSHSRYKQQRDGGDGLPDVTIDVDGMFSLVISREGYTEIRCMKLLKGVLYSLHSSMGELYFL